jgi:hypothetical protein
VGLALRVYVKAVYYQGLAVVRDFGFGRGHDAAGYLHAQVFVEGHEGQLGAGAFDDVAAGDEAGFFVLREGVGLCI